MVYSGIKCERGLRFPISMQARNNSHKIMIDQILCVWGVCVCSVTILTTQNNNSWWFERCSGMATSAHMRYTKKKWFGSGIRLFYLVFTVDHRSLPFFTDWSRRWWHRKHSAEVHDGTLRDAGTRWNSRINRGNAERLPQEHCRKPGKSRITVSTREIMNMGAFDWEIRISTVHSSKTGKGCVSCSIVKSEIRIPNRKHPAMSRDDCGVRRACGDMNVLS